MRSKIGPILRQPCKDLCYASTDCEGVPETRRHKQTAPHCATARSTATHYASAALQYPQELLHRIHCNVRTRPKGLEKLPPLPPELPREGGRIWAARALALVLAEEPAAMRFCN